MQIYNTAQSFFQIISRGLQHYTYGARSLSVRGCEEIRLVLEQDKVEPYRSMLLFSVSNKVNEIFLQLGGDRYRDRDETLYVVIDDCRSYGAFMERVTEAVALLDAVAVRMALHIALDDEKRVVAASGLYYGSLPPQRPPPSGIPSTFSTER